MRPSALTASPVTGNSVATDSPGAEVAGAGPTNSYADARETARPGQDGTGAALSDGGPQRHRSSGQVENPGDGNQRAGAGRDGAGRDGAAGDGAARDGAAGDGSERDQPADTGRGPGAAPGSGTAGKDPARLPAPAPHRPTVGMAILIAHPLGSGAVPEGLENSGFEVVVASDAGTAIATVAGGRADAALVDGRFEGDGITFCESLWQQVPGFPVLLTGPDDENLVTHALASGADDYLVLPLRPAELVARVRAVLRRAPPSGARPALGDRALRVGEVRLDPDSHEVTLRDRRVHLALREFELLRLLMENAGIVLARATLITRLWGPLAALDSTSLEVHIRRLRSKIEDDPADPKRIVTVRGIGYRYQGER
ncbi:MAG TPA: response regulator transcription factor [Acidimicrobiales bacterium]|nr:response regulator transcription factor [Acidimicrobiales bacterium]